jgi:hypothetical protein
MKLAGKITLICAATAVVFSNTAFAKCKCSKMASQVSYKQEAFVEAVPLWAPYWYAEGNIGLSVTHDNPTTTGHVKNTGPGWSVIGGYQFTQMWGLEAGYTQYRDSYDDLAKVNIANTQHYAVDLAATGQYPIPHFSHLNVLGKLGAAYNYARKDTPGGPMNDAKSVSVYGGLGFAYNLTRTVDVLAQWARSWGNHATGSTDLYSIGLKVALV